MLQTSNVIEVDSFLALTIGIIVYFTGAKLNERIHFLRGYNIPDPVTGGMIASLVALALYLLTGKELSYDLTTRDILLVYFFTAIGINARISDLIKGGKPLAILLALTLVYIVLQDAAGVAAALAIGQPSAMGVLAGSASLIGGHGTVIAWAPEIAERYGITNALEIGIASATLGLVVASLIGGPIAKVLMAWGNITADSNAKLTVGIPHEREDIEKINHTSIMAVILVLHVAIIVGFIEAYAEAKKGRIGAHKVMRSLNRGDYSYVVAAMALMSGVTHEQLVKAVLESDTRKLISVAWKCGFDPFMAETIQKKLPPIKDSDVLAPDSGGRFPFDPTDMDSALNSMQT